MTTGNFQLCIFAVFKKYLIKMFPFQYIDERSPFFLYKFNDFHRFMNVLCSDSFGKLKLGKVSKSFDKTSQIHTHCCYPVFIATNNIFVCNIHKLHPVCTTVLLQIKYLYGKLAWHIPVRGIHTRNIEIG